MNNTIEITKELLLGATDYVPLAVKEEWAAANAPKCFDKLAITADGESVPPMYMVNTGLKSRYLMAALASLYFHQDYEADERDDALMSIACYDKWAGGHALNQIERWKREIEIRDKCFDLLADFKDLEKRFAAQINSLLTVQNDSVIRQSEVNAMALKELPALLEQIKDMQGQAGKAEEEHGE